MGTLLSPSQECHPFYPSSLSHDLVVSSRGYTDALGSSEYNRSLSTFRANVVKSYLAGKGINPNRMRVIGMGNAAPRMANNTPEGRAANRRVEIELVTHKP